MLTFLLLKINIIFLMQELNSYNTYIEIILKQSIILSESMIQSL